jgi:hypothetical protein
MDRGPRYREVAGDRKRRRRRRHTMVICTLMAAYGIMLGEDKIIKIYHS